jgi:hypothetical protein
MNVDNTSSPPQTYPTPPIIQFDPQSSTIKRRTNIQNDDDDELFQQSKHRRKILGLKQYGQEDTAKTFFEEKLREIKDNQNLLDVGCTNTIEKQGRYWVYDPFTNELVAGTPSYWLISLEGQKHCFNLETLLEHIKQYYNPAHENFDFSTGEGSILQNFRISRHIINQMAAKLQNAKIYNLTGMQAD